MGDVEKSRGKNDLIDINAVSNFILILIWFLREKWVGLKMQLIFGMHFISHLSSE